MAFLKRLGWYMVGVSIGLIFLAFILKKKGGENGIDFCYLPNCRVLKDIRSKSFEFNGKENLKYSNLPENIQAILKDGNIDFRESNTKTSPCKTYLIVDDDNENFVITVENCPEKATVITE
ncbi:hypothetical protein GCM10011414_12590 [Croceivirga lutea]|uniref:DUF4258 domain-containing protein n=1 Tax=Croceivirga lutea TaxID=1775167 RepID=UPI0016395472|nr:DUF4258 domain-containing protein [Croceivirga lutea]GGG44485.1 hypothetical protein GCM10011414_12590 [Croceivirga lutea]